MWIVKEKRMKVKKHHLHHLHFNDQMEINESDKERNECY